MQRNELSKGRDLSHVDAKAGALAMLDALIDGEDVDQELALINVRAAVAELVSAASTLSAGLPEARWDQPVDKRNAVLTTVLGPVNARAVMRLRAALARVLGGAR